jgi:hypothetical protein
VTRRRRNGPVVASTYEEALTMTSEPDREYLEQQAARIDRLGVAASHHSNLVSTASRLLALRVAETDERHREQLDLELDAVVSVIEGDGCDELRERLMQLAETAVDLLAARAPGSQS